RPRAQLPQVDGGHCDEQRDHRLEQRERVAAGDHERHHAGELRSRRRGRAGIRNLQGDQLVETEQRLEELERADDEPDATHDLHRCRSFVHRWSMSMLSCVSMKTRRCELSAKSRRKPDILRSLVPWLPSPPRARSTCALCARPETRMILVAVPSSTDLASL